MQENGTHIQAETSTLSFAEETNSENVAKVTVGTKGLKITKSTEGAHGTEVENVTEAVNLITIKESTDNTETKNITTVKRVRETNSVAEVAETTEGNLEETTEASTIVESDVEIVTEAPSEDSEEPTTNDQNSSAETLTEKPTGQPYAVAAAAEVPNPRRIKKRCRCIEKNRRHMIKEIKYIPLEPIDVQKSGHLKRFSCNCAHMRKIPKSTTDPWRTYAPPRNSWG